MRQGGRVCGENMEEAGNRIAGNVEKKPAKWEDPKFGHILHTVRQDSLEKMVEILT